MLISNPGYECLFKCSRYADPGLQVASPQNNLVSNWGAHPSIRTLGSDESSQAIASSNMPSRHATSAQKETADIAYGDSTGDSRLHWWRSVGRETRMRSNEQRWLGVGCRER